MRIFKIAKHAGLRLPRRQRPYSRPLRDKSFDRSFKHFLRQQSKLQIKDAIKLNPINREI